MAKIPKKRGTDSYHSPRKLRRRNENGVDSPEYKKGARESTFEQVVLEFGKNSIGEGKGPYRGGGGGGEL